MNRRILVGLDGSEPSVKALMLALELAGYAQGSVRAVYVVEPVAPGFGQPSPEVESFLRGQAEKTLERARLTAQRVQVPFASSVEWGNPVGVLAELAEREDAWLVAVGSRGLGPLKRILLGSVASRLAQVCNRPVLIVR